MKISVVGDSFSSDEDKTSWIDLLKTHHRVVNHSRRGISQYRIFKTIVDNIDEINQSDAVIIWHTNADRIFVNDGHVFPTRALATHPHADLLANDSLSTKDRGWKQIADIYYRFFYDQAQQDLYHRLMVQEINDLLESKKLIQCSGFRFAAAGIYDKITSFDSTKKQYPGNINHFDAVGNRIVFDHIVEQLT